MGEAGVSRSPHRAPGRGTGDDLSGRVPCRPPAGGATAAACEVREGSVPASRTSVAGHRDLEGEWGGGLSNCRWFTRRERGAQTKRLGADSEPGAPGSPTVRARGPSPVRGPRTPGQVSFTVWPPVAVASVPRCSLQEARGPPTAHGPAPCLCPRALKCAGPVLSPRVPPPSRWPRWVGCVARHCVIATQSVSSSGTWPEARGGSRNRRREARWGHGRPRAAPGGAILSEPDAKRQNRHGRCRPCSPRGARGFGGRSRGLRELEREKQPRASRDAPAPLRQGAEKQRVLQAASRTQTRVVRTGLAGRRCQAASVSPPPRSPAPSVPGR